MTSPLPEGFGTTPATQEEIRTAFQFGQSAGADFVVMVRETEEDGAVDEQTLLIFCPEGAGLFPLWEKMAAAGHAIRCSSPAGTPV